MIPNEFGYRQPLWFFVLPSHWGFDMGKKSMREEEWIKSTSKKHLPVPADEDVDVGEERARAFGLCRYLTIVFCVFIWCGVWRLMTDVFFFSFFL